MLRYPRTPPLPGPRRLTGQPTYPSPPPPDPQKFSHTVGCQDSNRPPPLVRAFMLCCMWRCVCHNVGPLMNSSMEEAALGRMYGEHQESERSQ